MKGAGRLSEILKNRAWTENLWPFPHVTAESVFKPAYYSRLEADFHRILDAGLTERRSRSQLGRNINGYDAYGLTFPIDYTGPFSIFWSRQFHDMIAELCGAPSTGHVNCGLHHHAIGSANGWVHNDLNPAFFVDYQSGDGINVTRHDVCTYSRGKVANTELKPRRVVRSVAVLFYLANDGWAPRDGGCTGLYECQDDSVDQPTSTVPPISNSILVFQCTPWSFHSFMTNPGRPRNSLIMWLHRNPDDVIARWGKGRIVEWPPPVQ
jgi:hypothetical protein